MTDNEKIIYDLDNGNRPDGVNCSSQGEKEVSWQFMVISFTIAIFLVWFLSHL